MDEMFRAALADYFDPGEFALYIGVTVDDLIEAFPDEVDEALDELKELMEYEDVKDSDD
jgi:hypothetical protein